MLTQAAFVLNLGMTFTKKELREYMRQLGRKGGSVTSEAKRKASRANMAKINARKRKKQVVK
jgi:hypothetical protein